MSHLSVSHNRTKISLRCWFAIVAGTITIGIGSGLQAQLPEIRLNSIFPNGGRTGSTLELTIQDGANLEGLSDLKFSNSGIRAFPVGDVDPHEEQITFKKFRIEIDPQVVPGIYDVWALGAFGASNPRSFEVTDQPELVEVDSNQSFAAAMPLKLNDYVSAQFEHASEVDYYRFEGVEGQSISVVCLAEEIDSRAQPVIELYDSAFRRLPVEAHDYPSREACHFVLVSTGTYYLKVFDVAYRGGNQHWYRLCAHTRPSVDHVIPASGLPGTRSKFQFFGRNLSATRNLQPADETNLETLERELTIPGTFSDRMPPGHLQSFQVGQDRFWYRLRSAGQTADPVSIQIAQAPVVQEHEPNDLETDANEFEIPFEMTGQFQNKGDRDLVEFAAMKDEVLWIEVFGSRDHERVDPYLVLDQVLSDQAGKPKGTKRISSADDATSELFRGHFETGSDDPIVRIQIPETGRYRLTVQDRYATSRGNRNMVYRLLVKHAKPDFRLVAVPFAAIDSRDNQTAQPCSLALRKGDCRAIRILALRRDGFDQAIEVKGVRLPEGVSCTTATIGPGETSALLLFSSSEDCRAIDSLVEIVGESRRPDGVEDGTNESGHNVHRASYGAMVWPGSKDAPAKSRVSRGVMLSVTDEIAPVSGRLDANRFRVNRGRQIFIPLQLTKRESFDNQVTLAATGQPKGVTVQTPPVDKGKTSAVLGVYLPSSTPVGFFSMQLNGQTQVAYRRPNETTLRLARDVARERDAVAKTAAMVDAAQRNLEQRLADLAVVERRVRRLARKLVESSEMVASVSPGSLVDARDFGSNDVDATSWSSSILKLRSELDQSVAESRQVTDLVDRSKSVLQAKHDLHESSMASMQLVEEKLRVAKEGIKPANVNVVVALPPVEFWIKEHPATLQLSDPSKGVFEREQKYPVGVVVNRVNGFEGPVQLSLGLPPGVSGIHADPIDLPADASEGVLTVSVDPDAPDGTIQGLVVRATMEFHGVAMIDQPLPATIKK